MRRSASETSEYKTNLSALLLIGSIRWFGFSISVSISEFEVLYYKSKMHRKGQGIELGDLCSCD